MSVSAPRDNLYLDRYFPEPENPGYPQPPAPSVSTDADYGDFDSAWGEEAELPEESPSADLPEGDPTPPEGPSQKQEALLAWLEGHGKDLENDYEESRERLSALVDGVEELSPEQKLARLREVEAELDAIEDDLAAYHKKEEKLADAGPGEEDWLLEGPIDSEELASDLEDSREALQKELDATQEAKVEAEEKLAQDEAKAEENRGTKQALQEALGYLNGSKGELYFTAKVWGDKHIKDYHEDVTENASRIVAAMADAAVSGDWETVVKSSIDSLSTGAADNTLALVYTVIEKQDPRLFEKIPSQILEAMSDAILRGNDPGDKNIYYIKQDGKYDAPKDDRRRKDMHHFDLSYQEAADRLAAQAELNRQREQAEAEKATENTAEGDAAAGV
ncbi:MAG: hypothetical protein U1F66_01240 [bacterium]